MEECKTLNTKAKKLKCNGNKGGSKGKSKNKTWTKKFKEDTAKSKEKCVTFVKKAVRSGVKQELKSMGNKHKSNSDGEDMDLNAFDIELQEFNYEDGENMVISNKVKKAKEVLLLKSSPLTPFPSERQVKTSTTTPMEF